MTYIFLEEELESILLFVTAPIYFTIVGFIQSKNLKILGQLKSKKLTKLEKESFLKDFKKLKFSIPFLMLIGFTIHISSYILFSSSSIRLGYFISIGIMYLIYVFIALINYYLRGAGILKNIGRFNGLPGN